MWHVTILLTILGSCLVAIILLDIRNPHPKNNRLIRWHIKQGCRALKRQIEHKDKYVLSTIGVLYLSKVSIHRVGLYFHVSESTLDLGYTAIRFLLTAGEWLAVVYVFLRIIIWFVEKDPFDRQ